MSMLSRFATLGGGGDPYWSNVSLLVVGNGTNGTTTNIKDSSSNNLSITNTGSTVISTTISPPAVNGAGSGTVYLNGTSQYLSTSANAVFGFGTGDYTLEMWLYYTGGQGYTCFFANYAGTVNYIYYGLNVSTYKPFLWNDANVVVGNTDITLNTWQHHAVVRKNGTVTIYLNGVNIGSSSFSVDLGASKPFAVGAASGAQFTKGYIYDLRVTKGVARYTANYTPPPFPPTSAMPTY
jgi:hypothetical protein